MSVNLAPLDQSQFAAALDTLTLNFSLRQDVVAKLKAEGVRICLVDATWLQTARVHRALQSDHFQQAEQARSKVSLADLDSTLGDSEPRDVKTAFGQRHKLRFPPEVHPSDTVVSQVTKELAKRTLCVFNIWKVKNLQFQLITAQKKRKLGENLYTEEAETEEQISKDADTCLDKLYTLLLADALAGAGLITLVADPPWGPFD